MSSAILYLAIVAIWACVLIPRWLRRDSARGGSAPVAAEPTLTAEPEAEVEDGMPADAAEAVEADEAPRWVPAFARAAEPLSAPVRVTPRRGSPRPMAPPPRASPRRRRYSPRNSRPRPFLPTTRTPALAVTSPQAWRAST